MHFDPVQGRFDPIHMRIRFSTNMFLNRITQITWIIPPGMVKVIQFMIRNPIHTVAMFAMEMRTNLNRCI